MWEIPTDISTAGGVGCTSGASRHLSGFWWKLNLLAKQPEAALFEEGLKERRCEMCGQDENWHGRTMSLILDHINGVPDDNRLENLRIVCPNCAATLETHCGRKNRI